MHQMLKAGVRQGSGRKVTTRVESIGHLQGKSLLVLWDCCSLLVGLLRFWRENHKRQAVSRGRPVTDDNLSHIDSGQYYPPSAFMLKTVKHIEELIVLSATGAKRA